jgi:hypothetical protein
MNGEERCCHIIYVPLRALAGRTIENSSESHVEHGKERCFIALTSALSRCARPRSDKVSQCNCFMSTRSCLQGILYNINSSLPFYPVRVPNAARNFARN